jgi:hypothetical protein
MSLFTSKKLALEAMERVARRLYKGLLMYHPSRGGSDYRREFGFCIVEEVRLEDQESGDEVPSSTDEESEDDF